MLQRPKILIPASFNEDQPPAKYHFNVAYTARIVKAGGFPIGIMRPDESDVDALFPTIDGLFLMGGNDIESKKYGEVDIACVMCEPQRDQVELLLIAKAIKQKIPILAICRGFQILNVAHGGTLFQDVEQQMEEAIHHDFHYDKEEKGIPRDFLAHDILVAENSILRQCAGVSHIKVNSLHHQGIKALGKGLRAVAHAPDGLIEAVEIEDHPFGLGVQWHPEELHDEVSKKIFSSFIDTCKKSREKNRS